MVETDKNFTGSIPEIYDAYLVPLIFEAYAHDLAQRAARVGPTHVLETAAGTGVVARYLMPLLPQDARYVITDLNQAMLDRAATRLPKDPRLMWRAADALMLPFDNATFETVCCQFGAMFFPDRIAGYREARRVMKPGGRFLFSVWDRIDVNDFSRLVTQAAAEVFPADPPRFLTRTPHGYHDTKRIEEDLGAAGFKNIEVLTLAKVSEAPSARHAAVALCQGTPLRNEIEARDANALETVTSHAAKLIANAFGEGPVAGKMQAHIIVARQVA